MILLDTNLLGRMTDSTDPQCAITRRAVHVPRRPPRRRHANLRHLTTAYLQRQ
jgi:hypothetical protein